MTQPLLFQCVQAFAGLTQHLADDNLERPWAWGAYAEEGVRFAFFRVYEELRTLAVRLLQVRAVAGQPPSSAQRILAQYHVAYRDMQAALLGVPAVALEQPPAEGQWSVHQVLGHIVEADIGFFATVSHALEQLRSGVTEPEKLTLEAYEAIVGLKEAEEEALLEGPLSQLLAFHDEFHGRIVAWLAGVSEAELPLPSMFWEGYALSVRFRLHRFDSHMRQHTVQIDKALVDLSQGPTEAQRLLRLIYAALGDAEGALIGAEEIGADLIRETVEAVNTLTTEIAPVIGAGSTE